MEYCWYIAKIIVFFKFCIKPDRESFFVLGEIYDNATAPQDPLRLKVKAVNDRRMKYVVFEATDLVCPVGLLTVVNDLVDGKVVEDRKRSVIYPGEIIEDELLKKPGNYRNLFVAV